MNIWLVIRAAVFIGFLFLLAFSLAKAAGDADQALGYKDTQD